MEEEREETGNKGEWGEKRGERGALEREMRYERQRRGKGEIFTWGRG